MTDVHSKNPERPADTTPTATPRAAHLGAPREVDRLPLLVGAQRQLHSLDSVLNPLARAFGEAGHELYLVGGSVRDALLGQLGTDLDFTTDARPDVVTRILKSLSHNVWDTGIDFGTVSAQIDHWQIEITTFRSDSYDGVSRNPEVQFGDTIEEDLVRRDFTANAIAVRLLPDGSQEFVDPLDGLSALVERVLDTPQAPEVSFHDDPLRMLRACRFVSKLGFHVAPRVIDAIKEMAGEIDRITAERIQVELDKLMLGTNPEEGIDLLCDTGLADHIFPEIPAMKIPPTRQLRHKNIYTHSLQVLRQAIDQEQPGEPDLVLRWAALLHDVGKPPTRAPKPGGGVTFYQHDLVGARMVRKRFRALKYPKNFTRDVAQLVYLHLRIHGYGGGDWTDSAVRRYVTDAGPLLERLNMLVRADCTTGNPKKRRHLHAMVDNLEDRIAELRQQENLDAIRPDLDGNDIMQILDLTPGPAVGKAWNYMKQLRMEEGPMERDAAIAALKEWWEKEGTDD